MAERPLETGWLADTPVADTVLRRFQFNQADANEVIGHAVGGRVERTDDVSLVDVSSPIPYYNQALLFRPVRDATDPVLDLVDGFAAEGSGRPFTLLSSWPTPDLSGARLAPGRPPGVRGAGRRAVVARAAGRRRGAHRHHARGPGRRRAGGGRGLPARRGRRAPAGCRAPAGARRSAARVPDGLARRPACGRRRLARRPRRGEPVPGGHAPRRPPAAACGSRWCGPAPPTPPTSPPWRSRATTAAPASSAWASCRSSASPSGSGPADGGARGEAYDRPGRDASSRGEDQHAPPAHAGPGGHRALHRRVEAEDGTAVVICQENVGTDNEVGQGESPTPTPRRGPRGGRRRAARPRQPVGAERRPPDPPQRARGR